MKKQKRMDTMSNHKDKKNSLLVGGLTSTAGLFITKAIGILYVAPFRAMVGAENYVYYAAGYELYDLMLTISLAGLPFAIAAIVSKYMEKEDYKSVMLVKKISQGLLAVFGFIAATVVLLFLNQFVGTRGTITVEQAQIYKNVYMIMTLSIFTVPLLSSFRGFFQGIKDYASYSASQVIEQVVRVAFLLGVGALCLYVFNTDRIWAVYIALFATAISALVAIVYLTVVKKENIDNVKNLAAAQEGEAKPAKDLAIELFLFAIPYLASVILSNRYGFANMVLLPNALQQYGYDVTTTQLYTSLITNETVKLVGIPTVLATGFSVAVIPEMSQALVRLDYKTIQKNIRSAIESVMYIGLPIFCAMYFLSDEIYYILFGGPAEVIALGGEVTKAHTLLGIISLLSPVIASITMTLNLRRQTLITLIVSFLINFILLPILVVKMGWYGSILVNMISTVLYIGVSLVIIKKQYNVNFRYTNRKMILMFVSLVPMIMIYYIFTFIGIPIISLGKLGALFSLGLYGIMMLLAYIVTSNLLYLPQSILHVDFRDMFKKVVKR